MSLPEIKAHFIDVDTNKLVTQRYIRAVPRKGDELRLYYPDGMYKVTLVVWVYDEDVPVDRVNIGIRKLK